MSVTINQDNIFEAVLNAVTDSVTVISPDLKIQFQNEANLKIFGPQTGCDCYGVFRGQTSPCEDCIVLDVIRDGKARRAIRDVRLPDGDVLLVEFSATPLLGADGSIVGAVEAARDVTAQKKADALLSQSLLTKDKALRRYHKELTDAAGYVKTVLPAKLTKGRIITDWLFRPCVALGGDSFGYHWIDDDHFAMYLIDVSGHGWAAALLSVSVLNVLRSQTLPKTDFCEPQKVLYNLNNSFPGELHNDMFFSIWYGVYQASTARLTYAAGGHPPAILMTPAGGEKMDLHLCRTRNFILGGRRNTPYGQEAMQIEGPASLYIFSDGIYEFSTANRAVWGMAAFLRFMAKAAEDGWPSPGQVLANARRLSETDTFTDDFTILQVIIG
jgi:serine phosphatase RsbU (regulator of sigma subunit)